MRFKPYHIKIQRLHSIKGQDVYLLYIGGHFEGVYHMRKTAQSVANMYNKEFKRMWEENQKDNF